MHGLFGEIHISDEAHQRRQNPAGFGSVKSLNSPAELFGHRRHLRQTSKTEWLDTTTLGLPLPTIQWPATALIEGLQWDNSIGPRKRAGRHSFPGCRGCPPEPVIVGNMETISKFIAR